MELPMLLRIIGIKKGMLKILPKTFSPIEEKTLQEGLGEIKKLSPPPN